MLRARLRPIVRFWHDGKPVGVGFLVGPRHIMTCAHVVADALGNRKALGLPSAPAPTDAVALDFVVLGNKAIRPTHDATVVPGMWHPEQDELNDRRDIAVLELAGGDAPAGTEPIRASVTYDGRDDFIAYGIKAGLPDGTTVEGRIQGFVTKNRVELASEQPDKAIRAGCSGGAVWNLTRRGFSGMIAEMHTGSQGRMIPISLMQSVFNAIAPHVSDEERRPQATADFEVGQIGKNLRKLLYSFDREQQEIAFDLALESRWENGRGPIVCLIGGLNADRPKLCRDRCINVKLRARLEAMQIGGLPDPVKIPWPTRPIRDQRDALMRLAARAKSGLSASGSSPAEIRQAFNAGVAPFVFFSVIERANFDASHRELFLAWSDFWHSVGAEPLNKPLAVFLLLQLDGATPSDFCLERFFEDDLLNSPPQGTTVFERLEDFPRDDIDDWLRAIARDAGATEDDLNQRLLPKLWRDLPGSAPLRLQQLEEWTLSLPI